MADIIICKTTMKERALLEYHNVPFTILENTNFPIKDIRICGPQSISNIITILERPRRITHENMAVLIDETNKDFVIM